MSEFMTEMARLAQEAAIEALEPRRPADAAARRALDHAAQMVSETRMPDPAAVPGSLPEPPRISPAAEYTARLVVETLINSPRFWDKLREVIKG